MITTSLLDQAQQLGVWRIHFRQIGFEIGRPEWDDQQELLRYLHRTKQATLFTRDLGFFRRRFCHANYCIVVLTVPVAETAHHIRRLLRHPRFNSRVKRSGKVLKLSAGKIVMWERKNRSSVGLAW